MVLLFTSFSAKSADWLLISTDNSSEIFLSDEKITDTEGKKPFKVKIDFKNSRDIMGLKYNSMTKLYVISCKLDLVNFRQQFAFNNDELVWTFPESTKDEKASLEIPLKVLEEVCNK